ncbi:MAG: methylenetetrahydrofolate reductase C-terminal domain-containing protein [Candidatus Omnitrophota bacterium]|nr:methylenetetrahydrofolate reductase C-terminal domain-containing protein [Candidatus Omnitrophota bacterium]
MIISKQKKFADILKSVEAVSKIFLIGCGECATTCKSGGEPEVLELNKQLEANGKTITGYAIPKAPCISAQIKTALAQNRSALKNSEAIIVLACGLGTQSVKENDRSGILTLPACDTLFGAVVDSMGNFQELCSACGDCVLEATGGICPLTRCSKGLLNGPCGGVNKGKCEVDKERDCAWVLIYKELEKTGKLDKFRQIQPAKDYSKTTKPRKLVLGSKNA